MSASETAAPYDLWYWPSIQGRGEFVRLFLAAADIGWRDRAREGDAQALVEDMEKRANNGFAPYAPPYLVARERIPKYFDHFEQALGVKDAPFMAGGSWSHVDTSLFQLIEGLRYAFPQRMAAIRSNYPRLIACRDAVAGIEGVARYLDSERRIAFNEDGIFRHYPELDAA